MIILIFLTSILSSCKSFVDVDLPDSQLTSTAVFRDYATADAAITSIYSKIRDIGLLTGNSAGLSNKLGIYADEMVSFGNSLNTDFNFYYNALLPSNAVILGYWNATYNQVYAANAIIEGVSKSTGLSSDQKNQFTGEALFIRALCHSYLVNLFGNIPYIVETDFRKNSTVSRLPMNEVYAHIIRDLEQANALLKDTYSNQRRTRINKFVVNALLARMYLYDKSYAEAANIASYLINQTQIFSLNVNLDKAFLINSGETIWQVQSTKEGQNTEEAFQFIFTSGPPPNIALSDDLVNSFTQGDLRRSSWIKAVTDGKSTWFHAFKYKEKNVTTSSVEYSIIFRLAEQYLIRAEARAQEGNLTGALEDLNKIRNRAGLQNTTANSKEELLQRVLEERRWEFFSEYGHRFFDLKRMGKLDQVLLTVKPGWTTTAQLFPIPQTEISANPNIGPQNEGY